MFQSFNKQDDILKNTKEVPVTVPVYEGYLYWYSDKQKWKWHLFRFDGLSFICLSTRRVKLPRDTPIEQDDDHGEDYHNNSNYNNNHNGNQHYLPSPTSPLLATPKHPYTEDNNVVMASHYQLPSWSVSLLQVTSISLLALTDKSQQRNCFCIRTRDNKCYLMKTRKHKDLDRWLFVLTKAWNWTQIQQKQQQVQQQQQQQQQYYRVSRSTSPPPQIPPLNISPATCDENTKKLDNGPPTPPPHFNPTAKKQQLKQEHNHHHQQQQKPQPYDYYEPNYTSPILSAEKEKWIDEWRDSLQSMAMPSPMCRKTRHSTPIILDDHDYNTPSPSQNHTITLQQQQQQQQQQCTRQRPASMSFLPLANQPSSFVKKKRSDEVKNWISSHPEGQQDYDVQYFQDVNTTEYANDTSTHHNSHSNHSSGKDHKPTSSPLLHYHRSIRGRNVKIITNNQYYYQPSSPVSQKATNDYSTPLPPFNNHSPLHVLSKAESTQDVFKLQSTTTTHRQQQYPPPPVDNTNNNNNNNNNVHNSGSDTKNTISLPNDMYYHPQRSSSSVVVAPSLPPMIISSPRPSYYGMSSSLPMKSQCSTNGGIDGGGGRGDGGVNGKPIVVFHPSRSTPTQGIPLVVDDHSHSLAKCSPPSLIPTLSFPTL